MSEEEGPTKLFSKFLVLEFLNFQLYNGMGRKWFIRDEICPLWVSPVTWNRFPQFSQPLVLRCLRYCRLYVIGIFLSNFILSFFNASISEYLSPSKKAKYYKKERTSTIRLSEVLEVNYYRWPPSRPSKFLLHCHYGKINDGTISSFFCCRSGRRATNSRCMALWHARWFLRYSNLKESRGSSLSTTVAREEILWGTAQTSYRNYRVASLLQFPVEVTGRFGRCRSWRRATSDFVVHRFWSNWKVWIF